MAHAGKHAARLFVILVLVLGAGARADSSGSADSSAAVEATSAKQPSQFWLWSEPRQMGHWLDGKGITGNVMLINDWSKNFRGGSSSAGSLDRYSLDVSATLDDKKAFGWNGGTVVTEQSVWSRKRSEPAGEEKLSAFLQYGRANGDVSKFTRHLGGGIVLESPFAARPHDAIGVAATSARFTDDPDAGFQENAELAVELYYKISVKRHISLLPDLQFIHHPGGLRSQRDAVVLTPRLNISF